MFEHQASPQNLDPNGLYRRLIELRAQALREVLVKRLIRRCQKMPVGLLANAGLRNLWEEICIAIRRELPMYDLYVSHLEDTLDALIVALPAIDQQTVWLTTYHGVEYATSLTWLPSEETQTPGSPSLKPSDWPLNPSKIATEIIHDEVLYECFNYENARIRAYEGR